MTSLHRGMFVLLTVGALGALPRPTMADERSPLFVGVPPTRTAPVAAAIQAAAGPAAPAPAGVASDDTGPLAVPPPAFAPFAANVGMPLVGDDPDDRPMHRALR